MHLRIVFQEGELVEPATTKDFLAVRQEGKRREKRQLKHYNPDAIKNRHALKPTWDPDANPEGRWRRFSYEELVARDKTSLDVFWLKDKSLTDLDSLPEPDELAEEIIENLEAGLNSFRQVLTGLGKGA